MNYYGKAAAPPCVKDAKLNIISDLSKPVNILSGPKKN